MTSICQNLNVIYGGFEFTKKKANWQRPTKFSFNTYINALELEIREEERRATSQTFPQKINFFLKQVVKISLNILKFKFSIIECFFFNEYQLCTCNKYFCEKDNVEKIFFRRGREREREREKERKTFTDKFKTTIQLNVVNA